jgi:hypothetical protein
MGSTGEDTQRKRKRSRTSRSPDSDDNKKRGRPRVDKQDESAADVRCPPPIPCSPACKIDMHLAVLWQKLLDLHKY